MKMARPGGMSDSDSEPDEFFYQYSGVPRSDGFNGQQFNSNKISKQDLEQEKADQKEKAIFLSSDVNRNEKISERTTSVTPYEELRMAVMQGNLDVVEVLLVEGIPVDQIIKNGWTSLMFACASGRHIITHFLLQNGANPNLHKDKFTALMAACASSSMEESNLLECVKSLISHGAQVNDSESQDMTPLMFASKEGRLSLVNAILESAADINMQDSRGWTALCWAASKGYRDVVKCLTERSADLGLHSDNEQRASQIASSAGYTEIKDFLEKAEKGVVDNVQWEEGVRSISETEEEICPQLEVVLSGIHVRDYIPVFKKHKINIDIFLRLEEKDLIAMGIKEVGVRNRIEECILEIHKQKWTTASLPDLTKNKYLTASDASNMIENINRHIRFMHASIGYLRDQVEANPTILQLEKEMIPIPKLAEHCSTCSQNIFNMNCELKLFKKHLDQICNRFEYGGADLVTHQKDTGQRWKRNLLVSLSLATLSATAIYVYQPSLFAKLFSVCRPSSLVRVHFDA